MKEYERQVLWLDYFNSERKRSEGRRVPLSSATRDPKIEELGEACRRLNLHAVPQAARYPSAPGKESGYVSVPKAAPKQDLVIKVAKELTIVRGQAQRRQASVPPGKKK